MSQKSHEEREQRFKKVGLGLTAVSTLLLIANAISPQSREQSGLPFLSFLVGSLTFEWAALFCGGLLIVWVSTSSFQRSFDRIRQTLVRASWVSPRQYLKHSLLSLAMLTICVTVLWRAGRESYWVLRARYFYLTDLLDDDYGLKPLRAAYRHQQGGDYRAALKAYESVPSFLKDRTVKRNELRLRLTLEYVDALVQSAERIEAETHRFTRTSLAARAEALRVYPKDRANFLVVRKQIGIFPKMYREAEMLPALCRNGDFDTVLAALPNIGWFAFDWGVVADLSRGPFGEPLPLSGPDICRLVASNDEKAFRDQLRRSWEIDSVIEVERASESLLNIGTQ